MWFEFEVYPQAFALDGGYPAKGLGKYGRQGLLCTEFTVLQVHCMPV